MWLSMNTNAGARVSEVLESTLGRNGLVIFSVDGLEDTTAHTDKCTMEQSKKIMDAFIGAEVEHVGIFEDLYEHLEEAREL